MKLKIVGNGDRITTKIINAETGEPLQNVLSLTWTLDGPNDTSTAVLEIACEVDVVLEDVEVRRYRMLTTGEAELIVGGRAT